MSRRVRMATVCQKCGHHFDKSLVKMVTVTDDRTMRKRRPSVFIFSIGCVLAVVLGAITVLSPTAHSAPLRQTSAQSTEHTLSVDGRARTFRLHRPATSTRSVPLVIMLHGGFGSAKQAEDSYGWDTMSDQGRFAVAYPDGIGRSWNAGTCCGSAAARGVDDVAFIRAMITDIRRQMPVDPQRIYATGMSNGAMMALRLACETTLFAAVAPVAGTQLVACGSPHPTSVLAIHGTADTRVPYDGGPGETYSIRGSARVDGPSIPSVNQLWRRIDDCRTPTTSTGGAVTTSSADCAEGRKVVLISVRDAGHQWPGSARHPVLERLLGTDPPSTALNATQTIWRFFAST